MDEEISFSALDNFLKPLDSYNIGGVSILFFVPEIISHFMDGFRSINRSIFCSSKGSRTQFISNKSHHPPRLPFMLLTMKVVLYHTTPALLSRSVGRMAMWIPKHRPELNRHDCLVWQGWQRQRAPFHSVVKSVLADSSAGQFTMLRFSEWLFHLKKPLNWLACLHVTFFLGFLGVPEAFCESGTDAEVSHLGGLVTLSHTCFHTGSQGLSVHTPQGCQWGKTGVHKSWVFLFSLGVATVLRPLNLTSCY